jgi:hypothetical protein
MVLELRVLFHDKVAIQQINTYKFIKKRLKYKLIIGILIQLSYLVVLI